MKPVATHRRVALATTVLIVASGSAACASPCPAVIGVARTGATYYNRGPWVRQSLPVMRDLVHNGCYPEMGPSPTSSVTLYVAPGAPAGKLEQVYKLLEAEGWPKSRVDTRSWNNAPREPK